jgi:hypothetical protein
LHSEEKERSIPTAYPGSVIRRGHQGVDLVAGKEFDRRSVVPLAWDGQDTLDQRALGGLVEGGVFEERVNRRKSNVAAPGAEAALLLQVVEECANDGGIQILEPER